VYVRGAVANHSNVSICKVSWKPKNVSHSNAKSKLLLKLINIKC